MDKIGQQFIGLGHSPFPKVIATCFRDSIGIGIDPSFPKRFEQRIPLILCHKLSQTVTTGRPYPYIRLAKILVDLFKRKGQTATRSVSLVQIAPTGILEKFGGKALTAGLIPGTPEIVSR